MVVLMLQVSKFLHGQDFLLWVLLVSAHRKRYFVLAVKQLANLGLRERRKYELSPPLVGLDVEGPLLDALGVMISAIPLLHPSVNRQLLVIPLHEDTLLDKGLSLAHLHNLRLVLIQRVRRRELLLR